MEHVLSTYGTKPDDAARDILDQIAQGNFWVSPHPELLAQSAQGRATHLSGLHNPALAEQAEALLFKK
jgi:hypothetical protein